MNGQRESELLGHVRLLRDVLWQQLRRPSTETREKAIAAIAKTQGPFSEAPEPWGDDDWLDGHTIERVCVWLDERAEHIETSVFRSPIDDRPALIRELAQRIREEFDLVATESEVQP